MNDKLFEYNMQVLLDHGNVMTSNGCMAVITISYNENTGKFLTLYDDKVVTSPMRLKEILREVESGIIPLIT